MKPKVLIPVLCFIFIFLGCSGIMRKDSNLSRPTGALAPSATPKFPDLPVPGIFKFVDEDSYLFESTGVRVAVLRYRGKASAEQVINFYREQMPTHNWNLLNVVEYGNRLMNFDRENETCNVSILSKGSSVTITISLGPKSQNAGKKTQTTIK